MTQFERSEDSWLLNLGFVSEHSEQNMLLYGYISSPGISHVELMFDANKRCIKYAIVLDQKAYRRYKLQSWLERKSGLLAKLALLSFLRMFGSYDPAARITRCIRDYAGPSWSTSTEVLSVERYSEVVSACGTEGWVFQDGPSQGAGTPG